MICPLCRVSITLAPGGTMWPLPPANAVGATVHVVARHLHQLLFNEEWHDWCWQERVY